MKPEEVLHRLVTRPHLLDKFLHAQPYGPFDVDFQNEDGDTALHLACRMGIVQSCKLLMKHGAAFLPNKAGDYPSQVAVKAKHLDCKVFLEKQEELHIQRYAKGARKQAQPATRMMPRDENSPEPTKAGCLMLRHTLRNDKWQYKERFFVLTEENLYFFESEKEWNQKGEGGRNGMVHIAGCQVAEEKMSTDDSSHCFRVADGQRAHVYHIGCNRAQDRKEWIYAIETLKANREWSQRMTANGDSDPNNNQPLGMAGKALALGSRLSRAGSTAIRNTAFAAGSVAGFSRGVVPSGNEIVFEQEEENKSDLQVGETEVFALHYHTADEGCPFPPDGRREFSLIKGQRLIMLDVRQDGYAVVRYPGSQRQGFCPGNYISVDGRRAIVALSETAGGGRRTTSLKRR